ncbi:SAM-dependent methyltransferase [Jatrophihabitans sp.]|jgi:hypothetical protein|uniref:SAM-dependent methyltransferase n=1 Tax=Jatrophihabitans sp. TaxID=1932789 RepID=UPI002F255DF9
MFDGSAAAVSETVPDGVDPRVPHIPRILDYLLDGSANFAADRQVAEFAFAEWPGEPGGVEGAKVDVKAARGALGRIVRHLAADCGIQQFLDIAPGVPTMDNTHLAARSVTPSAKTVYVDLDPVVVAYGQHLLAEEGNRDVTIVQGDFNDPQDVIAQASKTLDFNQPIGLILFGMLHFIADREHGARMLAAYLDAMPSGSYVAVSHFALDEQDAGMNVALHAMDEKFGEAVVRRTRAEVAWFFEGMELLEPGVVGTHEWRPTDTSGSKPLPMWVAVARKR